MFFKKKKKVVAELNNRNSNVLILGNGDLNCIALEENVKEALKQLGIDLMIGHVKEYALIDSYGVSLTPALVVNKKVLSEGNVISVEEVKDLLKDQNL